MSINRRMPVKITTKKGDIIRHLTDGFEKQFDSPMPRLDIVAPVYFGCNAESAVQSYKNGSLPINLHRLGSQKSPYCVSVLELAHYAYEMIEEKQP